MPYSKKKQKKIPSFVAKLLAILDDPNSKQVVQWVSPQAFAILQPYSFSKKILPKYCKHQNISSFIRQLNIYGFTKLKDSLLQNIYSNPNFVKNSQKKLKLIQRRYAPKPEQIIDSMQTTKLHQNRSNIKKQLAALKTQNQEIRLKNKMVQQQIIKITEQTKKYIQTIINYLCEFVGNNFNMEQNIQTSPQKQEQLYKNVVETLQQIQSLKDQNIVNNDQRIQKIIVQLSNKKLELEQITKNDRHQKLVQQDLGKYEQENLILLESYQYQNYQCSFQDPLCQLDKKQNLYFI